MSVFFNGRLWTSPAVASAVNDSPMFNPNPQTGNTLLLIGASTQGQPNTPLSFSNPSDAVAALGSGDLVDAITRAFNPSPEVPGPSKIIAIRVNPAMQSSLTLKDAGGNNSVDLISTDYGAYTSQIRVKVEAGSTQGLKLTTQLGTNYYSQDNVYMAPLSVQYTGAQSSSNMTISNSTVTLQAPTGTVVATLDLNVYQTVQQLCDRINSVNGFTASVLGGNGAAAALNGLDPLTGQDVKTSAYSVTANIQAVVNWFNSTGEGYVTATRDPAAVAPPAQIPFTYLSGGSDGVITNTQWSNAFTTAQSVDCQWLTPLSSSASIWAMADAHAQFMSSVMRMERRCVCGMGTGATDAQAIAAALAINSDRTSLTHLGIYDYNAAGTLTLYPAYIAAAMVAGGFAGVSPGTPMTNKALNVRGLERNLRNPVDTDALIEGGVLCIDSEPTGYRVVQSISTWLTNDNFNRVEQSTGAAVDFTVRSVRDALKPLKGQPATPELLGQAIARTESVLRACAKAPPIGPGTIVGDANNPAYKDIQASIQGDVVTVQFQCSPVIPANYILESVSIVPFSGTASAVA